MSIQCREPKGAERKTSPSDTIPSLTGIQSGAGNKALAGNKACAGNEGTKVRFPVFIIHKIVESRRNIQAMLRIEPMLRNASL